MPNFDDLVEAVRYFKDQHETVESLRAKAPEEIKIAVGLNTSIENSHIDDRLVESIIKVFELFDPAR